MAYGEYYGRWTAALLWYYVFRTSLRVRGDQSDTEDQQTVSTGIGLGPTVG